jgi:hypothetical protein
MLPEWVGLLPGQVPILSRVGHPPILARNGKSSWDRLKVFLGPARGVLGRFKLHSPSTMLTIILSLAMMITSKII